MIHPSNITGLVLAGGRATRMGGVDKGLQLFAGTPLAQHAAQRLSRQTGCVAINANRYLDTYRTFGYPVWPDAKPTGDDVPAESDAWQGPLAGMRAGLGSCTTPWLATVPCDSPLFPANLVQSLTQAACGQGVRAVMASAATQEHPARPQPVFSLLHQDLLDSLTRFLASGGRKTGEWLRSEHCAVVVFDNLNHAFTNANTMADLAALEGLAKPCLETTSDTPGAAACLR